MKNKILTSLLLVAAAAFATAADHAANLRQAPNFVAKITGGTYTYSAGFFGNGSGAVEPSENANVVKPAGSLNATFAIKDLFPQINSTANVVLTGSNSSLNRVDWAVSAPDLIGQTVPVTINGNTFQVTVTGVTGTLEGRLTQEPTPFVDTFNSTSRSVRVDQVGNGSTSTITLTGTTPSPFGGTLPVSVVYNPITFEGHGGPAPRLISSVSVTPNNVTGGQSTTGTITLDGPAPNGGLTATLTAGSSAIQVPQTVEILPGAATADFTVNTSAVGAIFTRPIFASMFGTTRSTNLTLRPAIRLDSLTVDPSTVNGGQNTTGTVRLNTTAPTNGIIVHLSSNSSALVVPSNVLVPEGLNQATFTIETRNVGATSVRTVTATYDGVSRSANVTINPSANLSTFIISPNTVNGGDRTTGTVTLDRPAGAEGVEVTLQSQSSIIIVPATVMIPSGQSQASFQITTLDVSATATRYVVATRGASSRSAALTVNPGAVLNRVEVNPATVKGGTNTTGTVHLTRAAPAGGAVVYLQSGSSALQVPATVNVAQGQTSATFTITTSRVGATVTRYITATRGVSRQVAVTLTP